MVKLEHLATLSMIVEAVVEEEAVHAVAVSAIQDIDEAHLRIITGTQPVRLHIGDGIDDGNMHAVEATEAVSIQQHSNVTITQLATGMATGGLHLLLKALPHTTACLHHTLDRFALLRRGGCVAMQHVPCQLARCHTIRHRHLCQAHIDRRIGQRPGRARLWHIESHRIARPQWEPHNQGRINPMHLSSFVVLNALPLLTGPAPLALL